MQFSPNPPAKSAHFLRGRGKGGGRLGSAARGPPCQIINASSLRNHSFEFFSLPGAAHLTRMAPARTAADSGRKPVPPKKIVDTIREATGASDEDISAMLAECNYDVNEATSRLIDSECGPQIPSHHPALAAAREPPTLPILSFLCRSFLQGGQQEG